MKPQNVHLTFVYYSLTLVVILVVHYYQIVQERNLQSTQESTFVFNYMADAAHRNNYHEKTLDEIINIHDLNKFSYQIFIENREHSHIKQTLMSRDVSYRFGLPPKPDNINDNLSSYVLVDGGLRGWIKLQNGYMLSLHLIHRPSVIEFNRTQFWSPLVVAVFFWLLFASFILKRLSLWNQTVIYAKKLATPNNNIQKYNTYQPLVFTDNSVPKDFAILSHAMSRASYQLYHRQRQVDTLVKRFERLISNAPLPMAFIQRNGKVNFINERFKSLFLVSLQTGDEYHLTDFIIGENKQTQEQISNLGSQKTSRSIVVKHIHNQDVYHLHIMPWFSAHGQVQGFTAMFSNINLIHQELKTSLQELSTKTAQVADFDRIWSVMGHELRTPLSGIIGMLELIYGDNLNKEQSETFETLKQTSQTMLQMLNDMLDLAKLDAGKLSVTEEKTDVLQLCRQVCELMVGNARRQGIELLFFYELDTVRHITTDEARLRQILLNLIGNAIKFTQSGHVALVVSMKKFCQTDGDACMDQTGNTEVHNSDSEYNGTGSGEKNEHHHENYMHFEIIDTGIGISDDEQKRLFSYFGQANSSISGQFGGTGLGLAISKNFAKLLGGEIGVNSDVGNGSTFYVSLPIALKYPQRAYQYQSDFSQVALIYFSSNAMSTAYINTLCQYYKISAMIEQGLDAEGINRVNTWLADDVVKNLYPVVFVDYETLNINDSDNEHHIDTTSVEHTSVFTDPFVTLNGGENIPKVLLSMTPERNVENDVMENFQGYIQKPLDVSYFVSELLRLGKEQTSLSRTSKLQMSFNEFIQTIDAEDTQTDTDYVLNIDTSASQTSASTPLSMAVERDSDDLLATTTVEALLLDSSTQTQLLEQPIHKIKAVSNTQPMILVAEDNPINQKVAVKLLAKMGYQTITANNGEEAIEQLAAYRHQVKLILMDCRMPTLDGLAATQIIRKKGDSIPIIALTANDTDQDRKACLHAGMDNFLPKPIKRDALQTLLNKYAI